jgi:formate-dependent nitrite reductase membrane component NrfD
LAAMGVYGIVLSRSRASYEKNLPLLSSMIYYALYLVIISALTTVAHLVAVEAPGAVLTKVRRVFEVLGLASAFPAGMQAGILLMAARKRPLWETRVLPYLYLFTGILAAMGVYGIVLSRSSASYLRVEEASRGAWPTESLQREN